MSATPIGVCIYTNTWNFMRVWVRESKCYIKRWCDHLLSLRKTCFSNWKAFAFCLQFHWWNIESKSQKVVYLILSNAGIHLTSLLFEIQYSGWRIEEFPKLKGKLWKIKLISRYHRFKPRCYSVFGFLFYTGICFSMIFI